MTSVYTANPRTGSTGATSLIETSPDAVDAAVAGAVHDSVVLRECGRHTRAELLERIRAAILAAGASLIDTAAQETGLPVPRLTGELQRAADQFGLFADVLRDGAYLEVMIDRADGPAPDIRRMLVPLGPVAVFGASNFPFAFSVLGGDTASALGAGCSVVAKAHPAHPLTSAMSVDVIEAAAREVLGIAGVRAAFGLQAGLDVVRHRDVRAVTLTGSLAAARGIIDAIGEREEPIPFFGELSSINPLIVLPRAAESRGPQIAEGLYDSFTGSGGQLCTKPGYAFLPTGAAGDRIVAEMKARVDAAPEAVLLSSAIRDHFVEGVARRIDDGEIAVAPSQTHTSEPGFVVRPRLLEIGIDEVRLATVAECFGPVLTVVRYEAADEVLHALDAFPASLTTAIHAAVDDDRATVAALVAASTERAGRIVFDGYPTGVRVSWAQHHGGPWPSTNSQHTSVGATAIRRFLRPIAFQNAPEWALPSELRDDSTDIPRRVDGRLTL